MININSIKSPKDIKGLDSAQLRELCDKLHKALLDKLAAHGGHVGPNLGVVEATVALHYVFNAPEDEIVFDVSHQCYVHKMLTGRIQAFTDPAHYNDVTGYTCPRESRYDLFEVGHTSTSISLATGLAKARDLAGGKQNVIAFIGDASLGGGEALEGLDNGPELHSNLIVVLNDNQHSIAENHGALYDHLTALRESNGTAENNIFKALGYDYIYVREGNDIDSLIRAFEYAKDKNHAVLVHINTMKGNGFAPAEAHKEQFHYSAPFNESDGELLNVSTAPTYGDIFAEHMLERMADDVKVATLTAGTPGVIGFYPDRRAKAGRQFIDVGICEQDAVAMSAGLAKGGAKPVFGVVSTFIQRAYDQLSQDVAINSLPVAFVDFLGGVYGINDMTHLGFFDVAMISNIPGIEFIAAANRQEYIAMIDYAIDCTDHPVFVRTPGGRAVESTKEVNTDFRRYDVVEQGSEVAIIGEGAMLQTALKAAEILKEKGVHPTVINPRILSAVDAETLDGLKDYRLIITIDDGIVDGAFGQKVAAYMATSPVKVVCLGLKKEFLDRYDVRQTLLDNSMTPEQIAEIALAK